LAHQIAHFFVFFSKIKPQSTAPQHKAAALRRAHPTRNTQEVTEMEMVAEAAEERGGKERVAAVGRDEVELDVGSEVEKAIEEGEIDGEGSQADEEVEEEEVAAAAAAARAFEVKGSRTMGSVWSRCSWRGRGGKGRGGFHPRPWYGAAKYRTRSPVLGPWFDLTRSWMT
jgi:hypothetical protein